MNANINIHIWSVKKNGSNTDDIGDNVAEGFISSGCSLEEIWDDLEDGIRQSLGVFDDRFQTVEH